MTPWRAVQGLELPDETPLLSPLNPSMPLSPVCPSIQGLNVYSILQHDSLVMTVGAARGIEERLREEKFQPRWKLRRQQQLLQMPLNAEDEPKAAAA